MKSGLLRIIFIVLLLPVIAFGKILSGEPLFTIQSGNPVLTGSEFACVGIGGYIYSTDPGMTGYVWTVIGGDITSGGTSTSSTVTVTWTTPGPQSVSITYDGASSTTTLNITVLLGQAVAISISANANSICEGTPVTFNATPVNGGTTPEYQWKVNGIPAGTSSPSYTYQPSNLDTVCCVLTSNVACATGNPAVSNCIPMNVSPNIPVSVSITASANPVCVGTSATFTATTVNGGTLPSYQWKVNNLDAGTNSSSYTYTPINGDVIICVLTSNETCTSNNPANSNQVTMTVSTILPVSVSITASPNPSCLGNPVIYTATAINSGTSPIYEWRVNGDVVGTSSSTLSYQPANGDIVTCKLTSSFQCSTGNPANSNVITMVVHPYLPVAVNISASSNPACDGSPVTFTATPTNGGNTPFYEWFVNGFPAGQNNPIFILNNPSSGAAVICHMTSSLLCCTGNPANSNTIIMTVSPTLIASIAITSSSNPACQGTPVTFTATPINGGTSPDYQWKVNGTPAGPNSPEYTYNPANDDLVTCQMTSNSNCVSVPIVNSNTIVMSVSPGFPAGVSIVASLNPSCPGNSVTFTAIPVNGGTSPSYQWNVNGTNTGPNSPFFSYIPVNGDQITCVMTSGIACAMGSPATSNVIVMTVSPGLPVSVSITASSNPSCLGDSITYTATPVNGGALPLYQWIHNGVNASILSIYRCVPADGDQILCYLTSSNGCATGSPATSNQITMEVNPYVPFSVSIAASANPSCQGYSVTYTATVTDGGSSPFYQWKVNNTNVGMNQPTFSYYPANNDIVKCEVASSEPCPVNNPQTSNAITMVVSPVVPAGISIVASANPVCVGTSVTFTATAVNAGPNPFFQWKLNGINVGTSSTSYTIVPLNGNVISCVLTSNALCVSGNPAFSNQINMVVSSELPVGLNIYAGSNPFCQGAMVSFTANGTNKGTTPVYQWKVNGVISGVNSLFSYSPQNGDFVTCQLTSNLGCATNNPANSNPILMVANTSQPVSVIISASVNPVCQGSPVTFTATPTNGGTAPVYQWKVNNIIQPGTSSTFTYNPEDDDIVTCRVTSNLSCDYGSPATSLPVTMSVNTAMPANVSISTLTNPFCDGSEVFFTAVPTNGGSTPIYQWKVNGSNQGSNSPLFSCFPDNGNTVTCELTSNSTCISGANPVTSSAIVLVKSSSIPASVVITSSATTVCLGTAVNFTALPVNGGNLPDYQWKVNTINQGTNSPSFTYIPANGNNVVCEMTSSLTCATGNPATSNTISMIVNNPLPVSVSISPSSPTICIGIAETFTATPINGGTTPIFVWRVNGIVMGFNEPTFLYSPSNGDAVTCEVTSNATCISGNPALSNQLVINVSNLLPVNVTITASDNPFCPGSSVTYTAIPVNGGTDPIYHWKVNGVDVGTNIPTYSYTPLAGDVITCMLTSNAACICNNPATSNAITMASSSGLPVSVTIVSSANPICAGTLVLFTATAVNGGTSPFYQWKINGVNSGINSPVFQYAPADGNIITCTLTSNLNCAIENPATSNPIAMSVTPVVVVSTSITVSQNPCCAGMTIEFAANVVNGGTNPQYQWKKNTFDVGFNSPTYSYSTPVNNDHIYCRVMSNATCVTGNPSFSNTVTMNVTPYVPASVNIAASGNPVCAGTQVTYTATPSNAGTTPYYQWKVNGINVGANSPTYFFVPNNGDAVICNVTSSAPCTSGIIVTSNTVTMTVSPYVTPTVSIAASTTTVCEGATVTFTATPVNGGPAPAYQWIVNGSNTGTNSATFMYVPSNNDVVKCIITSNASCLIANQATSNHVIITVTSSVPVSISIVPSVNPACQGEMITYTATSVNPGTTPIYQWMVNGYNVGTNNLTYSYVPTSGDIITCSLNSSITCTTGDPALSNQIVVTFAPYLAVSVSLTCSANPACQGSSVTLTAIPVNGGTDPFFLWTVNGLTVGNNQPTYSYVPLNGDIVICQLTSSVNCPIQNPVTSNAITINVLVPLTTGVSTVASENPVCVGVPVTFTATPTNGGSSPSYQWYVNGSIVGNNSSTYVYTPVDGDLISCQLTSSANCIINNPVISNQILMSVVTDLPSNITIAASSNPSCQGQMVCFTATTVYGGSNPVYQWTVNGFNVGSNNPTYCFTPTNGDMISCQLFSSLICATNNPALSNQVVMTVNPIVPVSVFITSSFNPACTGIPITFTATPVNGGTSPGYQWKVNGNPVGTSSSTYTYTPAHGDIITCLLTSSHGCVTGNPALSNQITMIIGNSFPVSVVVSASGNPICEGNSVIYTATPTNGGSIPSFQWKVNGSNVGLNQSTYAFVPQNGNVINCVLTSNLSCGTGNPATSNSIIMEVNPIPIGISINSYPTGSVCAGSLVTFTAIPFNGGSIPAFQWKVNGVNTGPNSPVFIYAPVNGDVVTCVLTSNAVCASGNTANSNAITCNVASLIPVSVSIGANEGTTVCAGTHVTYNAVPLNGGPNPSYQWKVNDVNSGPNNPSFTFIPLNGDKVTCELTSDITCPSGNPALSNAIFMMVNPLLPVSIGIAASPSNTICEGTPVTFTATPVNGGSSPFYQWNVNGTNAGANSPIYSYIPAAGDSVICILTSNALCPSENPATSNKIKMLVNPILPVSVVIAPDPSNIVCLGTLVTFTATPTNGGSSPVYQWKVNGNNEGTNSPVYSYIPANNDIITCTLTSSDPCAIGNSSVSNPITIMVNPYLPLSVTIVPSPSGPICDGTPVIFTAAAVNGGISPSYQWKINGLNAGINEPVYSYTPVNNDIITCTVTSFYSCVTGSPATSNSISMTVNPVLPVSLSISANPSGPICAGTPVTFTGAAINGGSTPDYQWKVNGTTVGTNNPTYSYSPLNGDLISCLLTSNSTCATGNPATSNTIAMIVDPLLPVGISISSSGNTLCVGQLVNFSAVPVNGGPSPTYQWKVNGNNCGPNLPVYAYMPANNDIVTCQLTSNVICPSGSPATSNPIIITVNPLLPVSISVTASGNPVCDGTPATFTGAAINGGSSPFYQWNVNGVNVGTNDPSYGYTPSNGDLIKCTLTSNASCATGNPANSNVISMTVNPNLPVSIGITANPSGAICEGVPVTFTGEAMNGGSTPVYQWNVNGVDVGINNSSYSYTPSNGDLVTCKLTSNATCATGSPASSNVVSMTVNPNLPVSIGITASMNPVCEGIPVIFTGAAMNGGSTPGYQWSVNGVDVGNNSNSYSYTPSNGDMVSCKLTSYATCPVGSPAISNTIAITVDPNLPVSIEISTSMNPICEGTLVTFTGTAINCGSTPVYQWNVNGIDVGTNSTSYSYTPSNGDLVSCKLTSNATCPTGNPANSNVITMTVNPNLPVSIGITASSNPVCEGTLVTFTGAAINCGSTPVYQWSVNGVDVGSNSNSYSYNPSTGDLVSCKLTSNATCTTGSPANSNVISMTVNPNLPVSIGITASVNPVCEGTPVTFTGAAINCGSTPVYQWSVNGIDVGINVNSYSYTPSNGDLVTCKLTSNATCATGSPANSNTIAMIVDSNLPVSIGITANPAGAICEGDPVTFSGAAMNGGSAPVYQWNVNGVDVGTNSDSYSYTPSNGDLVTCNLISNATCATGSPAISNTIAITVSPNLPVSITITASVNPVCEGIPVIFTGSAMNGGATPVYQWNVNGVDVGTNSNSYSYSPSNGDLVICKLTSNTTCATGSPATSNAIIIEVYPLAPVTVSITVPFNPTCEGTSLCYVATVINGGSSPVYQWEINGISAGSNTSAFCYIPSNGDVISCRVTSNLACASPNPANSNGITMIVNPLMPVSISIIASENPVCEGNPVMITGAAINGGSAPVYQWNVNGVDVGTNSNSYGYTPSNGDLVTCKLTSDATCATGSPAISNAITMTINPNLPVSIGITANPSGPICEGSLVTFTGAAINCGSTPVYQWNVNGVDAGTNNSFYNYTPSNGDLVTCKLTSNATCATGNPATSNTITMAVNPNLSVSIGITADPSGTICEGTTVTLSSTAMNGGSTPVYQWQVNTINVGSNLANYTYIPVNGDVIICILTSDEICTSGNPATSNPVTMSVAAMPVVTFSQCIDPVTTTIARPLKLKGGVPLGGTYSGPGVNSLTGMFYPSLAGAGIHQLTYTYNNSAFCTASAFLTIVTLTPAPFICGTDIIDPRDNQSYQTVLAGTQCWFARNLNYGQQINSTGTQRDNCQVEKYCSNDDPSKCITDGGFYHWDEMVQYEDQEPAQGLCPPGWHIPGEDEWNILFNGFSGSAYAGDHLKSGGSSGFNALLVGGFFKNRSWAFKDLGGFFWSSTTQGTMKAWAHGLNENNHGVSFYPSSRSNAYSVRCLND